MNTLESKQLDLIGALGRGLFKFCASVQLAIIVLLALMGILAAGTIIESLHGAEAASVLIYQSPWFSVVLLLLGINLLAAALCRLPWKIKHTGFVITHLGIILILIGSFITQKFMLDGQMVLSEGETDYRVTLTKPVLYVYSEAENREWAVALKKKPFEWHGRQRIGDIPSETGSGPLTLSLLSYFPKAREEEKLIAADSGPAAVEVALHNDFVHQTIRLVENDPSLSEVSLGPAVVRFAGELLKEQTGEAPGSSYLEFQFGDKIHHLPFPNDLKIPAELPIEDTDYKVQIVSRYRNATVQGKELIEGPDKAKGQFVPAGTNPAVKLILKGAEFDEAHTVFAKFPDFPTIHGLKPSRSGAKIFYRLPGGGSSGATHELRFIKTLDGLTYQVVDGPKITTGKVKVGEEFSTGWKMNLQVQVTQYQEHSAIEKTYSPLPNVTEEEGAASAIQLEIQNAGQTKALWVGQGTEAKLSISGSDYRMIYSQEQIPAGFRLTLKDFRVENYSGTDRPASFESDVVLKDDARGIVKEATISMNNPLIYRGVRIYQSGYSVRPGAPEISIFAIGHDPGVPLKYLGTIVMAVGIIAMFYTRKFSTNAGRIA